MVDELKRNGSGYYDPTAYKAMKNFEIGGVTTMKRGEIWKIGFGRDEKLAVVITVQKTFCNVLVLNEQCKDESDIAIKAIGLKYTNPAMMSYAFKDNFHEFIRLMSDHEITEVIAKINERLDFPVSVTDEAYFEELLKDKNEEIEALKDRIEVLVEQNEEVNHSITERTVIELTVERDLYKTQYEKMLERLIGA